MPEVAASSVGTHFGKYFLMKKLAAGGMGEVFIAKQQGPATPELALVWAFDEASGNTAQDSSPGGTSNGTYVAPHRATDPDHTQRNNYATKGNVNPSNGKAGAKYATR